MKITLIVLLVILLLSVNCKSIENYNNSENINSHKKITQTINKTINCSNSDQLQVKEQDISFSADSELCTIFSKYLDNNKQVLLVLKGRFEGRNFRKSAGFYKVREVDSLSQSIKEIKQEQLEFSNPGFINNSTKFQETIWYQLFVTNFYIEEDNSAISALRINEYSLVIHLN